MRLLPGYSQTEKMPLIPVQSKTERNAFTSGTMQEIHLLPVQSQTKRSAFNTGSKQDRNNCIYFRFKTRRNNILSSGLKQDAGKIIYLLSKARLA